MGIRISPVVEEVLRHAWQISWKHKALWIFSILPLIPYLFYLPLLFYALLSDVFMNELPSLLNNPTLLLAVFAVLLLTVGISLLLQVFSRSATTYGLLLIEAGHPHPAFGEILRGGQNFFWRVLWTTLLASLGMMVISTVVSMGLSLVGLATLGLGSLVGQVVMLPTTLLLYTVVEQAQVAAVAEALSPTDAILRSWEVVQENIESFASLTAVVYVGLSIAGAVATLLVVLPLSVAVLSRFSSGFVDPSTFTIAVWSFALLMPVYLFFQALTMLYRKSVHVITYLRLTRSPKLQPLPNSWEATS